MTHFDYITKHLLRAWVQSWTYNFGYWADLMTNNYEGYALLEEDDPEQECYEWFWVSLNLDDIYTKSFIEELLQMKKDVESGTVSPDPGEEVMYVDVSNMNAQQFRDEKQRLEDLYRQDEN